MNINFIGKEFEKLAEIDKYINYEFEPKANLKYGKRNIYYDELKHEFINDVNAYGFSPYILQSFMEQRENPNIKRFMKKKFNYGYTNYIKIRTKNVFPFSTRLNKKIKFKNTNEDKKEILKLIPDFFLVKKEKYKNSENNEKGNFLKKVLNQMGGHKLNISMGEDDEKNKDENNIIKRNKERNINKLKELRKKSNIAFIKNILENKATKEKNKTLSFNNIDIFGNNTRNNTNIKIKNLKNFYENIKKNMNKEQEDKKVLTLTKNKYILGNKKLFSSISMRNIHSSGTLSSQRKKRNLKRVNSITIPRKSIEENRNNFLLITKARPYKYMKYTRTNK
jgi:hypothetical protein